MDLKTYQKMKELEDSMSLRVYAMPSAFLHIGVINFIMWLMDRDKLYYTGIALGLLSIILFYLLIKERKKHKIELDRLKRENLQ